MRFSGFTKPVLLAALRLLLRGGSCSCSSTLAAVLGDGGASAKAVGERGAGDEVLRVSKADIIRVQTLVLQNRRLIHEMLTDLQKLSIVSYKT